MAHIDLHMHSNHSDDGEFAPERLVVMAREAGLDTVAVTDHNHASAVGAALAAGRELGVEVIPGIELSCRFNGFGLHVLGYYIDHEDARYQELTADLERREAEAGRRRLELVRGLGLHIDAEKIAATGQSVITGELLAETALADPANAGNPLLSPYRAGGARSDNPFVNFYWDNCSEGKPAYAHVEHQPLASAVALIVDTGGVPVLAHPGANLKGREGLLADIAAVGVKGVEAYSSYHSPEQVVFWRGEAKRLGLFVTCGSDFHGKTKPAVKMGRHGCDHEGDVLAALTKSLPLDGGRRF